MPDPWVDVREEIERAELDSLDAEDWAANYSMDCTRILADADALLAVVPFVNEIKEWAETHDELGSGDERDWEDEALERDSIISEWLSKAQDIFAALPEHLKEEA